MAVQEKTKINVLLEAIANIDTFCLPITEALDEVADACTNKVVAVPINTITAVTVSLKSNGSKNAVSIEKNFRHLTSIMCRVRIPTPTPIFNNLILNADQATHLIIT